MITVTLAAVATGLFFELSQEREPPPEAVLELEPGDGELSATHYLTHSTGDTLDGEQVEIRGVADPEALEDVELTAGERGRVYPVETTVRVVWFGDHGTSHTLGEFEVDSGDTVPEPDDGCSWVESESNGGTDDVKVDGRVVGCTVETDRVIEVFNGGTVIGDVESENNEIDIDDARLYGDLAGVDVVNVQNGTVTGSATSDTADVKVDDSTLGGSIRAELTAEVINGGSVRGDAVSDTGQVKILDSDVGGSVTGDSVKLDGASVDGNVYVDAADFDCTDSTVNGQDCGEYTPRDPDDYDG